MNGRSMSERLAPDHGWTCYHCGENFTSTGGARDHFGSTPDAEPGCCIKVRLGGERGLLMALREAESRLASYMEDDSLVQQEMRAMQSRHADALMSANEAGYSSGLRSGRVKADDDLYAAVSEAVAEERDRAEVLKRSMLELLATIHRDGGQYAEKHGIEKTCDDAGAQVSTWLSKIESVDALCEQARLAEREECASVCEGFDTCDPKHIAEAIRARSNPA